MGLPADVSIHAPAWGATTQSTPKGQKRHVSIHAPAWGATCIQRYAAADGPSFNPRARMGRDHTWAMPKAARTGFNPRARMGRDDKGSANIAHGIQFQSTRPHGARPIRTACHDIDGVVSIHAPAWGATGRGCLRGRVSAVSIHAPAWGATNVSVVRWLIEWFQSTRPHGARQLNQPRKDRTDMFQSTRPHGARPSFAIALMKTSPSFNPRARMGRDPVRRLR